MKKFFAPFSFYKKAGSIAVPLALQSILSSSMGIVDSLMVSWIGMVSAVGTATQIDTLAITVVFGAVSGTGIFCAQFFGAKDYKNLKRSFGLSLVLSFAIGLFFMLVSFFFGSQIIKFYLNDSDVIKYGGMYLNILKYSFIPTAISFAFSYVYRAIHNTKVPLFISIVTMIIAVALKYLLIFGNFGFPNLGVEGAAYSTIIAQCIGLVIHIIYAIKTNQPFIGSIKEIFGFDTKFIKSIMKRISPLIFNELMFGFGSTLFIKAFGSLGTNSMEAYYVGSKISEIFFFVVMGISNATAVMVGNTLGSGDIEKAKEDGNYFIGMAGVLAIISTISIILFAGPMVSVFGLKDPAVFLNAVNIVRVFSIRISLRLFIVIVFASLRAGGDSKILTFLDSGIMWSIGLPLAFFAVNTLKIQEISLVFLFIQLEQLVRVTLGLIRYNSGKWAVNLTKTI
jgi:putative MATE family efflux protein